MGKKIKNKLPKDKSPRYSHLSGSTSLVTASISNIRQYCSSHTSVGAWRPGTKAPGFSGSLNKLSKWSGLKNLLTIISFSLVPTFFIWLPFLFRFKSFWGIPLPTDGMATVVANYDGPLYIIVAKTLYNTSQIKKLFSFPLPVEYYAAHFPLYPLLIKIAAVTVGFPWAMLTITVLSSVLALYFFNKLLRQYTNSSHALWLTFIFALFPARWLTVRSVGSPEPLFITAIIASVYYFQKRKYVLAGFWGALAQLTKSPGVLLFIAFATTLIAPIFKKVAVKGVEEWKKHITPSLYPLGLIPLSLLGLFILYRFVFNDFLAYFHSGDNIHLLFPPFQVFNYNAPWVGTFWLEEIVFIYLIGALGTIKLFNITKAEVAKKKSKTGVLAWFTAIFFFTTFFVSHRDVMRYSLPIVPFLIIAWKDTLVKKEFKMAFILIIIPIYLASLAFISQNTMPISDWAPFL